LSAFFVAITVNAVQPAHSRRQLQCLLLLAIKHMKKNSHHLC